MAFTYKDYQMSNDVRLAKQKLDANSAYKESDAVKQYKAQLEAQNALKPLSWNGGTYKTAVDDALNKIMNRKKFTYDLNGDALYQQYKDQYINQGRMAMQDTIGQAAAMTGGYGNSYAATAGNQAYQSYLQQLNNKIPELYQMALDQYNQEGTNLQNQYSMLANQYNTEYGEYRDSVGDWQNQRDYLSNLYNNERNFDYSKFSDNRNYLSNAYQYAYEKDYGQYTDAYNRALQQYQLNLAEARARRSGGSGGSSSRRSSSGNRALASAANAVQSALGTGSMANNYSALQNSAKSYYQKVLNSTNELWAKSQAINYIKSITNNVSTQKAISKSLGFSDDEFNGKIGSVWNRSRHQHRR